MCSLRLKPSIISMCPGFRRRSSSARVESCGRGIQHDELTSTRSDRGQSRCADVAEQRAQGALHSCGTLGRYVDSDDLGRSAEPSEPVRHGKAIASGDQRLMQKAKGLEADIARLERLRAAHIDDQHAVRRQMLDAERDIEFTTRRIAEIGQDIARLIPTAGDAFAMSVKGKQYIERKEAGRALLKEILTLVQLRRDGDVIVASIGGFDLKYRGWRIGDDRYDYKTALIRTGMDDDVYLGVTLTPHGAGLTPRTRNQRYFRGRAGALSPASAECGRRLSAYQSREGGDFAFAGNLADKRRQLCADRG